MKVLMAAMLAAFALAEDDTAARLAAAEKKIMESCLSMESDVSVCDCGITMMKSRTKPEDLLLVKGIGERVFAANEGHIVTSE